MFPTPKTRMKIDKTLLISILILLFSGITIFLSASLGVLSSNELKFYSIIKSQIFYVFVLGLLFLFIGSKINYKYYKKFAIYIFIFTLLFSFSTLIPSVGFNHNGATRWIHVFGFSFQPSELLKFGSIVLFSFLCVKYKKKFEDYRFGVIFIIFITTLIASSILFFQRDFGTFSIILFSGFVVYFVGGAKFRHVGVLIALGLMAFLILIELRPYMKERVLTFFNPDRDLLGASYQLNQSLIAVGSGGVFGRGFGQSIQKFNYLPEQISDSIFAVYAEELGFVGSVLFLLIYLFIIFRGIYISKRVEDNFAKFLAVGIISIFFIQLLLNIASSIGLLPLTGVPLPLVSRGGSSLVFLMFILGILLNISKYRSI